MTTKQMAQQEGGWPLGLQPLNVRIGPVRNLDSYGSLSFNTLITGSPSSSSFTSSDLDTESTGSFFHDRSITLGSLIGITSIFELSSRSIRSRNQNTLRGKKSHRTKTWFSLCPRTHLNSETAGNAPSLGHFLEMERRASNAHRRNQVPITYELHGLPESQPTQEPNSLFIDGLIVPPRVDGDVVKSNPWVGSHDAESPMRSLGHDKGYCFALLCPCVAGQ